MKQKIKIGLICYDTQFLQITNLLQSKNINVNRIIETERNKIKKYFSIIKELKKIDILYFGYGVYYYPIIVIIAKLFHKKVVMHWIGTDVINFSKSKYKNKIKKYVDLHFACSSLISQELAEYGINASVIPIVPINIDFKLSKVPREHAVLFYLPTGKEKFYGLEYLEYLSRKYESILFYVVGNEKISFKQSNIVNLGRISLAEMDNLYDKISILIRIPEHDGLSIMLLEALIRGKEVLYCYDFPFTFHVTCLEDSEKHFSEIISTAPKPNIVGRKYVLENYKLDKIRKNLYEKFIENGIIKDVYIYEKS